MFLNVLSKCLQVPVPVVWKSFSKATPPRWPFRNTCVRIQGGAQLSTRGSTDSIPLPSSCVTASYVTVPLSPQKGNTKRGIRPWYHLKVMFKSLLIHLQKCCFCSGSPFSHPPSGDGDHGPVRPVRVVLRIPGRGMSGLPPCTRGSHPSTNNVAVVVVIVVVGITACSNLCVFKLFNICIKTKSAPRLHEVLVYYKCVFRLGQTSLFKTWFPC